MNMDDISPEHLASVAQCHQWYQKLHAELGKAIVGQEEVLQQVTIAILARGHVLLEGLPGLPKSLLVRSLAEAAQLSFRRVQLTPDVVPADLTGTETLLADPETGQRCSHFTPGALFANLVVVDELDRAVPRTQSTVFEAMHDRQVTVSGRTYPLPDPFFVLATHSPQDENEHRLPATQLDRFSLLIRMAYPDEAEEWEIARRGTSLPSQRIVPQVSADDVRRFQNTVGRVEIDDQALGYAWTLVRATRPTAPEAPDFVDRWIIHGAGPRGLLALVSAAKTRALMHGRGRVAVDDIETLALPALRHRVMPNHAAEANALSSDRLIQMIMESVPPDGHYPPPSGASELS